MKCDNCMTNVTSTLQSAWPVLLKCLPTEQEPVAEAGEFGVSMILKTEDRQYVGLNNDKKVCCNIHILKVHTYVVVATSTTPEYS